MLKISKMAEIIVETISKLTLNFIIYKLVLNSKWYLPSFNSNDFLKLIHFQWGEMVLKCHRTNNTVTFNFTSYIKIWYYIFNQLSKSLEGVIAPDETSLLFKLKFVSQCRNKAGVFCQGNNPFKIQTFALSGSTIG